MANKQDCSAEPRYVLNFLQTFLLKLRITDRQHLVDDQDLRLQMRRDGEGQAHIHSATVALDRRVEEFLDLGKGDDLIELARDLLPAHAEDRAIQEDVLATGQFGVKAGADLEQAADAAAQPHPPLGRLGDAAEDLEQRALAGSVAADDADDLALLDLEADILQRPEFLDLVALNDLSAVEEISRLAHEIARLAPNDVTQRRITLALQRTGDRSGSASTDFRRR